MHLKVWPNLTVVFMISQTISHLIETGNSEQIFQNAMQEMGRGQVPS